MDFYRIVAVKDGVQRVLDIPVSEVSIVAQEARWDGWRVSYVLLPEGAELIPGVLEESVDMPKN